MEYRIIGDIHGRSKWEKLISNDAINIFIGDYFDPYDFCTFKELKENFLNIVKLKKLYPDSVVLLLGNHDLHYWWCTGHSHTSRFISQHCYDIESLFNEYRDCFQMAYSIENQYLVTHAGVSQDWYNNRLYDAAITPDVLAKKINKLFLENKTEVFSFSTNCNHNDYYGTSPQQSCVWIRPETLVWADVFVNTKYSQIFGHTQVETIKNLDRETHHQGTDLYMVDCLEHITDCLIIQSHGNNQFTVSTFTGSL